jgi:hypothetical protein
VAEAASRLHEAKLNNEYALPSTPARLT